MADGKDGLIYEGAMQTMSVAPPDESVAPQAEGDVRDESLTRRLAADPENEDRQLDVALDQSMDASDPPSATQPGRGDPNDESEAHPS